MLHELVAAALKGGASDIHLEPGLPVTFRSRDGLKPQGQLASAEQLLALAKDLLPGPAWDRFQHQGSADLAMTLHGHRVRVNVLKTWRGVGLALRVLSLADVSFEHLHLSPQLRQLLKAKAGLIVVSGATGSGKTTTLAAMVQELNQHEARHIITLESPIEYVFEPKLSFIRQREVGRDTPSFERGIIDGLRENPDVLLVGEMREPAVMRVTLNAAETGHLVLATMHAANATEALQRIVASFPPDAHPSICAQLADSLVAVVSQRLVPFERLGGLVPEMEILKATSAVRSVVRQNHFAMLPTALEGGGMDGQLTFERSREWLRTLHH
ncbi:MAG: PilT/PilU family type 4a pilus ATPase [Myxococcaceae bacterium]|nr:PilT/PilU family type 4a pilus ATPase [Myxococcaceae bacterium]